MTAAAATPHDTTESDPPPVQAVPDTPADEVGQDSPGAEVVQFRSRNSLNAKVHYARYLAQSGLLPVAYREKPANVLFAVEYGEMLNLPPMAAINGIHIIEGKPTASAALISALVRRAGHKLRIKGDDKSATVQIIRADDPDWTFESVWTLDRAKAADLLGKKVWRQYPAAMLKSRAITECARDACQEALSGVMYTAEELGWADVDEDGAPVKATAEVGNREQPAPRDLDAEIAACGDDHDKLTELWKSYPQNSAQRERIAKVAADLGMTKQAEQPTGRPGTDVVDDVVDAELVDDDPQPARPATPANPDALALQCVTTLLGSADLGEIGGIAATLAKTPKVANRDVSSELTERSRPGVAAELGFEPGAKVTVLALASRVEKYVDDNGYSVANGVALAAQQAQEAS